MKKERKHEKETERRKKERNTGKRSEWKITKGKKSVNEKNEEKGKNANVVESS